MGISRESLAEVIGDLKNNREKIVSNLRDLERDRDQLLANLEETDRTINSLELMYKLRQTDSEAVRQEVKELEPQAPPQHNAQASTKPNQRVPRTEVPGIGLAEAVAMAADEGRHDQTKMSKRVIELRPGTSPSSAATQVSIMLKNKRIHKGDDLVIRNVVDGKVQGLPVRKDQEAELSRSLYGQHLGDKN